MAIYRCWQQKGIRRLKFRKDFKQRNQVCSNQFQPNTASLLFCKIKSLLIYGFLTVWNWLIFIFSVKIEIFRLLPLWIYELFLFCPFKNKDRTTEDFLIIGHRDAAAYEIENTIPAFEKALNIYNANALEIDLSFTKDQQIVLWHDWDPDDIVAIIRQAGLEPSVKYRPFVPMNGMWRKPVNKLLLSELRELLWLFIKKVTSG